LCGGLNTTNGGDDISAKVVLSGAAKYLDEGPIVRIRHDVDFGKKLVPVIRGSGFEVAVYGVRQFSGHRHQSL
jgi:hypothetical protein